MMCNSNRFHVCVVKPNKRDGGEGGENTDVSIFFSISLSHSLSR